MVAWGADVFDSSSYGHYARGGRYMTPFGAIADAELLIAGEYRCGCPVCCAAQSPNEVFDDVHRLAAHNLWTISDTIRRVREALVSDGLDRLIEEVLRRHVRWFPTSRLLQSWEQVHEG